MQLELLSSSSSTMFMSFSPHSKEQSPVVLNIDSMRSQTPHGADGVPARIIFYWGEAVRLIDGPVVAQAGICSTVQ